jgi:hypothetical protein
LGRREMVGFGVCEVLKSGDEIADSVKEWTTEVKGYQEIWKIEDWLFGWRGKKKVELGVRPI